MSLHDRYCAALVALGAAPVPHATTGKYTVFSSVTGKPFQYYVGRAGAVRVGRTVSASIAKSDAWKAALLSRTLAVGREPSHTPVSFA